MKHLLGAALAAAVLTGCTGAATTATRPAPDGAQVGGVLRIGITQPGSVDPGNDYEPTGDLVISTMCDPLITVDPRTGELTPGLLQSWVVSNDGARLVLRLRKDARFSDGSRVTADDVAYSLSRVASADYASAAADRLQPIAGYGEVHGDVQTDDDSARRALTGVSILDDQSLEIALVERRADFLRVLTSRLTTPVPRALASKDPLAFSRRPVCSGPYALAQPYRAGDPAVVLERVRDYRGAGSAFTRGGAGYAERIEFQVFATAAAAAKAQRAGTVDVAAAEPQDRAGVQSVPGPEVELLGFPTTTSPLFDKPDVRRALALALDRVALAQAVYPATRVAATGFLPPTARPVYVADACADLPVRGDVPAAKALLAKLGVDLSGARVTYTVNDDGRNAAMARAVAAQWRKAFGLVAAVRPVSFDAFVQTGTSAAGFDGPFRFSWRTAVPDPDGMLYPLFSTERIGRDNFSRFSRPSLDRLLVRQARQAESAQDRQLDYRAAEQELCSALPMVPLTFSLSRHLVAPTISSATGAFLDGSTGLPLLRELYRKP